MLEWILKSVSFVFSVFKQPWWWQNSLSSYMMNLQYMIPNTWQNNFQELLQQHFRINKGNIFEFTIIYSENVKTRVSPLWDRTSVRLTGHSTAAFWITYALAYELCLQTTVYPHKKIWNSKISSAVPCLCLPPLTLL